MSRICQDLTLDQIDDWFKIGQTQAVSTKTVPKSSLDGKRFNSTNEPTAIHIQKPFIPPYKRHSRTNNPSQTNYAKHFQDIERQNIQMSKTQDQSSIGDLERLEYESQLTGLTSVSKAHGVATDGLTDERRAELYKNYEMHDLNASLPIAAYRDEIVNIVENNQVTVIEGSTGSGKTTQVPQYILKSYMDQNRYCNIVVTQPRRIAAMSIANRVCYERKWQLGGICGYQVGLERTACEDTRILYCTTGVLLNKLISEKSMRTYTHVILDEVHERDEDSDFCLLVVKKFLHSNSPNVKVVLMSATIDSKLFANYFSLPLLGQHSPAPVLSIKGRTFDVREFFIEDLKDLGPIPSFDPMKPEIPALSYDLAVKLIQRFDALDERTSDSGTTVRGSVLVFLPGIQEITELNDRLDCIRASNKFELYPLHSQITGEEQVKVFQLPKKFYRKIILSTNIAESSITVSDINFVIDFTLTKCLVCDHETNYPSLKLQWASKSNAKQRMGRAGRVRNGRVYHMVTRRFYQECLEEHGIPEMQRCPLEQLVLRTKVLDIGEPLSILGLAISPPNLDDVERTILLLKEVGALISYSNTAHHFPHDGRLTFLGFVLAKLPLEIHVGKLVMLGHVFGLLEECIIIAAGLSLKSMFANPFKAHLEAYMHKLRWSRNDWGTNKNTVITKSDCLAILFAYKTWKQKLETGMFENNTRAEVDWCHKMFLQRKRIREVHELVRDITLRLKQFNIEIVRPNPRNQPLISMEDKLLLLKIIFCGAFYPNFFIQSDTDENDVLKSLSGHNPYKTVLVRNLPTDQGPFYNKQIENIFQCCSRNPRVYFEGSKAFVEMKSGGEPSDQISESVYIAVKMRQLRINLEIRLYDDETARKKLEVLSLRREEESSTLRRLKTNRYTTETNTQEKPQQALTTQTVVSRQVDLPSPKIQVIDIYVTEVVECGHFWAHNGETETWRDLCTLQNKINNSITHLKQLPQQKLTVDLLCLALYRDPGSAEDFYRARIVDVYRENPRNAHLVTKVQVFYLDYGNTCYLSVDDLREIPDEFLTLPFQSMEFELAHIKPSLIKCPYGTWSREATQYFRRKVIMQRFYARVYSIVHGIIRVELSTFDTEQSIREDLINQYYADKAEESLLSRKNNEEREYMNMQMIDGKAPGDDGIAVPVQENEDLVPCRGPKHRLLGPHSELEVSYHSITLLGKMNTVKIDNLSVNSVALDDNPGDKTQQVMVAAYVGLSPNADIILARDTTIMPRIPDFLPLLSLIFCPLAEMRVDAEQREYIGALCGLGWNSMAGGPAFPDHDIELSFDTKFTLDDLKEINGIRMAINIAFSSENGSTAKYDIDSIHHIQAKARKKILDLITRPRTKVTRRDCTHNYRWNLIEPEDKLHPQSQETEANDLQNFSLLTLHSGVMLREKGELNQDTIQNHIARIKFYKFHVEWLRKKANRSKEREEIECELCSIVLQSPSELLLHLATVFHRDKNADLQRQARKYGIE